MFGMEKNNKGGKNKTTVFDLETNLQGHPHKKKELLSEMKGRLETLKSMLRKGHKDQKTFEEIGYMLHGYNAMIKVINRIK